MLPSDVTSISRTLDMMAELEQVISEFYMSAAERWPEDKEFWLALADAEVTHAGYLKNIKDILNRKPDNFEIGRPIAMSAVAEVMSGVRNLVKRVKNGEFNKKAILLLSRDLEQSVLESKYMEMLKSEESEYQRLISEIISQTEDHQQLLIKKIVDTR